MNAIPETNTESNSAITLNPPENAPKDGTVFLAYLDFAYQEFPAGTYSCCEFVPAFYDSGNGFLYAHADMVFDDDDTDETRTFFTEDCDDCKFIGWVPMPKLDGNRVVFQS